MSDMEILTLETPYGRVSARGAGSPNAELVLGLHGWSQRNGWHSWEPLMQPLADAGYYVVSVDLPGWGNSPAPLAGLDQTAALAVIQGILNALSPERPAVLMGKSWGGGLALETALATPGRVSKLILTAPAFSGFDRLRHLRQPVLLVWAEDDPVIPIDVSHQYRATVPDLRLVVYPTGGHSAAPKNAAAFAPTAIDFLSAAH